MALAVAVTVALALLVTMRQSRCSRASRNATGWFELCVESIPEDFVSLAGVSAHSVCLHHLHGDWNYTLRPPRKRVTSA